MPILKKENLTVSFYRGNNALSRRFFGPFLHIQAVYLCSDCADIVAVLFMVFCVVYVTFLF